MKSKVMIIAMMLCVALFNPTASFAQNGTESLEEVAQLSTDKLNEKLDLSDEQESKVYIVTLKYLEKAHALKSSTASRMQKYKAYQADNAAKEKEMKAILTKEQFKEWQKISAEQKEQMKENRNK